MEALGTCTINALLTFLDKNHHNVRASSNKTQVFLIGFDCVLVFGFHPKGPTSEEVPP